MPGLIPSPLTCHDVGQQAHAFLSGTLPPAMRVAIDNHLAQCAACRGLYAQTADDPTPHAGVGDLWRPDLHAAAGEENSRPTNGAALTHVVASLRAVRMPPTVWDRMVQALHDAERRNRGLQAAPGLSGPGRAMVASYGGNPGHEPIPPGSPIAFGWLGPSEMASLTWGAAIVALACLTALVSVRWLVPQPQRLVADARHVMAVMDAHHLAHRHQTIPDLHSWRRGPPADNASVGELLGRYLKTNSSVTHRLNLPPDIDPVSNEELTFENFRVLHLAFNTGGYPASIFIFEDFAGAVALVGYLGRSTQAAGQTFEIQRPYGLWLVIVAQTPAHIEALSSSIQPPLGVTRQP